MGAQDGEFIWYELMTSDVAAAETFYGAVVGWTARSFDGSGNGYRLFSAGEFEAGGLMAIPEEAACNGARPGWLGYIGAENVDAVAARIVADGGKQHMPPSDIPGVGRFAMLADRQGAPFYIMRGAMEGRSEAFSPTRVGHCHWNELGTSNQADAIEFYSGHFGWHKSGSMPMGPMGDYVFIMKDEIALGAVSPLSNPDQPSGWLFYFGVADIEASHRAILDGGGTSMYGPAEVPGGVYIVIATDPQGATFGVVGPKK